MTTGRCLKRRPKPIRVLILKPGPADPREGLLRTLGLLPKRSKLPHWSQRP